MNPPKGKRLGRGGALPERNTGSALLSAGTRSGRYLDYNPTPDRSGRDSIYPDRHSSRTYACQARPIRSPPRPSTLLHSDLSRPYPIRSARFRLVFTQPSYPDLIPIRPNLSDPALPNRSYPIGPAPHFYPASFGLVPPLSHPVCTIPIGLHPTLLSRPYSNPTEPVGSGSSEPFVSYRSCPILSYPVLSCPGPFTRGFFPCAAPGAVWCGRTPAGKASGPGDTRRFRLNARNDGYAGRRTAADPPFSARTTTVVPRSARCAGGRPHTV